MTQEMNLRFAKLRREVIAREFQNLNNMQQQAVLTTEGPLLLLAGAGSGKTTVLIHRIANLIRFGCGSDSKEIPPFVGEEDIAFLEEYLQNPNPADKGRADLLCALHPAEPWSIIAITFTNKAADQLKERLANMLGPEANDIWAMTFHSACCRILRREIERMGFRRDFAIYDTADSQHVLKQVIAELELDEKSFAPKSVLGHISRAKDRMHSPEDVAAEASLHGDFFMEQVAKIYHEYQKKLRQSNALDFDDIILLTVQLLEEHADVREHYQRKFRYVLIDEYQDTNYMQYRLAALLTGERQNICVVGDDDQSIYKFRGATIENILNFEQHYKGARTIRLEQNYRSMGAILDGANAVIRNNRGRKGKTLWTEKEQGEKIKIFAAETELEEADYVAGRIFQVAKFGSFRDCAILYRTNAQSNALERVFQRSGIPYRMIGGHRFYDRAEVKDMLAYLYVINNPDDDFHLERIVNNPPRGIGAKTMEMTRRQASAAGCSLHHVISRAKMYPCLDKAVSKYAAFTDIIQSCRDMLDNSTLLEVYDNLLERTGYLRILEEKRDTENLVRAENVKELRSSIQNYLQFSEMPTLSGFLEEVALFTDVEQYDPNADAVVMMTMHSAKGLEFPHVCLVGFEEGLFPGASAMADAEEMEEERRLCYVAITRAKETLSISYARRRMLYGKTSYNQPSRFLSELPDEVTTGKPRPRQAREDNFSYHDSWRSNLYGEQTAYISRPSADFVKMQPSAVGPKKQPIAAKIVLQVGDMVVHKVFGRGMVLTSLPMGNDALLEIAFDTVGTKKLMANTAAQYLTKE